MSRSLRNKHGCWTCRLRKKKCDERRPICTACSALSIICHGYGPKPDWMDHGEKEKEAANKMKRAIKESSKRKVRSRDVASTASEVKDGSHGDSRTDVQGSRLAPKPMPSGEHQPLNGDDDASLRATGSSAAAEVLTVRHKLGIYYCHAQLIWHFYSKLT